MYTADDFNCENAPKKMVQYVVDTVEDFDARYARAWDIIGLNRCPLRMADESLYDDIYDAMCEWVMDEFESYPEDFDYDIEEIFG
jgi:hypothetical protein